MALLHKVCLTDEDRGKLHDLLKVGEHSARTIARGYILLLAHQGKTDDAHRADTGNGPGNGTTRSQALLPKRTRSRPHGTSAPRCQTPTRWQARSLFGGTCLQ